MSTKIFEGIWLETIECCTCATIFAMSQILNQKRQENGGDFYCPNGHGQSYMVPEVVKLRNELERKARDLTAARCEVSQQKFEREKVERKLCAQKRRIAAGVCPCCKRTVKQLAQHMKTQHPSFAK